jgi:hypothetical protein
MCFGVFMTFAYKQALLCKAFVGGSMNVANNQW